MLALARSHAGEVHTSARSSDCRPPWYWRPPSPPELEVDCEGAAQLLGRGTYDTLRPRRGRLVLMTFRTARVRPEPCQWQPRSKFFVLPQALYESLEPKFYFRADSRLGKISLLQSLRTRKSYTQTHTKARTVYRPIVSCVSGVAGFGAPRRTRRAAARPAPRHLALSHPRAPTRHLDFLRALLGEHGSLLAITPNVVDIPLSKHLCLRRCSVVKHLSTSHS